MANNLDNLGPERLETGWPWKLLLFSLIVFGIFLAGYLGLIFGYETFLNAKIAAEDQKILALAQEVPEGEQKVLLRFYSQLSNLQSALNGHIVTARFFPLLEQHTHQGVYYTTLNLEIAKKTATLDGVARSYEVLAQQLEAYKQATDLVERFTINQADSREGKVNFRAVLFLKPAVFK